MQTLPSDCVDKINRIREALEDYLYRQKGNKLEGIEVLNISQRSFSTIIFLKCKTSSGFIKLVAKTVVHNPVNIAITKKENQAVVEYNILKFLHPKFDTVEGCSVPRPILVIPEIETFVMEFIEGHLLIDDHKYTRYFSSRGEFNKLRNAYINVGKWLKHFQQFTGIRTSDSSSIVEVINKCDHRLQLIEDSHDPRFPQGLRKRIMDFLQDEFKNLSGKEILVTGRHGDFTPINIIAGQDRITVIDFLGYKEEPIAIDLLKMLIFFENESCSITSNKRRVEAMKKSFLEGYCEKHPIPDPVIKICETMHRIVTIYGGLLNSPKRIHHYVNANLRIRRHLEWLENEVKT